MRLEALIEWVYVCTVNRRFAVLIGLFFGLLFAPSVASAKPIPTCKSPQNAVESVFAWQLGKQQSLAHAAKCLENAGRSPRQLEEAARRLKAVFDAEGAIILPEKLSDDSDFLDNDKNPHVVAHARYPSVFVEKRDGRWVWTRESLDWIDEYYADHLGALDRVIDAVPERLGVTVGSLALWQYIAIVLLFVGGMVMSRLLRALISLWMRRGNAPTPASPALGRRVLDRAALPMSLALFALFVRALYPELRFPVHVSATLHLGVRLTLSFATLLAAFRFADVFADGLSQRAENAESRLDEHLIPIIRKVLKAVTLFVGLLLILHNLNIDVTGLFATLGLGTLAIGLAAKDALANLFGGLSIFVDNPFKIGDWIHADGVDGVVEEVGFRSTRVRTFYDSLIVIPNAKLADSKIDNYGKRRLRRVVFTLNVVHGTTTEAIGRLCKALREVADARPNIEASKTDVVLVGVGGVGLEVSVTCFFHAEADLEEPQVKHELLVAVLDRVRELGVTLHAPPTPPALPPVADRR